MLDTLPSQERVWSGDTGTKNIAWYFLTKSTKATSTQGSKPMLLEKYPKGDVEPQGKIASDKGTWSQDLKHCILPRFLIKSKSTDLRLQLQSLLLFPGSSA